MSESAVSSFARGLVTRPYVLKSLQIGTISSLTFLSGLSFCLSTWVMPITMRPLKAPPTSGEAQRLRIHTATTQFIQTVTQGGAYLQPTSRILAGVLVSLTYLTSQHPSPAVSSKWRVWATALATLVPVAVYEVVAIFPTNDRVKEIEEEVNSDDTNKEAKYAAREQELIALFNKWSTRNFVRAGIPLASALIGFIGVFGNP